MRAVWAATVLAVASLLRAGTAAAALIAADVPIHSENWPGPKAVTPPRPPAPPAAPRRSLQAEEEDGDDGRNFADDDDDVNIISIGKIDAPALMLLILVAGTVLIGVSCLHAIDTPVAFETKPLPINREY